MLNIFDAARTRSLALDVGAAAFVSKRESPEALLKAIRGVAV